MPEPRNVAPDAFAGTAEAYLRFRPPYPAALTRDLLARADLPPQPRLVDLAAGPGRVALALASAFAAVEAVDLEPDMVEVGAREARRLGLDHVRWTVGRAEDFEATPATVDMVTIGEAFHRVDQNRVLANARRWLKPGGSLVTLGGLNLFSSTVPWQADVTALSRDFTRAQFPDGVASARAGAVQGLEAQEALIAEAGFAEPISLTFAAPHAWTFETVLGFLDSTSVSSRRVLGDRYEAFKAALAKLLADHGVEREVQLLEFGYTLARKPG